MKMHGLKNFKFKSDVTEMFEAGTAFKMLLFPSFRYIGQRMVVTP
jgi:hypothetical protein